MEIQFNIGLGVTLETVIDNVLADMGEGMKYQCFYCYGTLKGGHGLGKIYKWFKKCLTARGIKAVSVMKNDSEGFCRIGDCKIDFRHDDNVRNRVLKKYDSVHWGNIPNDFKALMGNNLRWHIYTNSEGVPREKTMKRDFHHFFKNLTVYRFVYHESKMKKGQIEGDIEVCRNCQYCGQRFVRFYETSNQYVLDPLDGHYQKLKRYNDTRENVAKAYKIFHDEPKLPNALYDFFGDRTVECGERQWSGESGKDLKEVVYVNESLCPYKTEHLLIAYNKDAE